MSGGGGGRINKPKSAFCKKNPRKEKRLKVRALKRLTSRSRSAYTLGDTTRTILRQCRTNPKANVHVSGKKRRLLMKEAKRLMMEDMKMDSTTESSERKNKKEEKNEEQRQMDLE